MEEDRSQTSRQRVTVAQASEILGVTVEAVRGRIKRGTLEHERHSGAVYVLLHADQMPTGRQPGDDQTTDQPQSDSSALISAKDETIAALHDQLEAERQAHAEARRIIAGLVERIPAIEAPQEAPEAAETVEEEPERAEPRSAAGEAREELSAERARRVTAETTLHEGMAEERRRREDAERERDELRRELYARREPRESPQTAEEQQGGAGPYPATGGAQEGTQRPRSRPWWRRIIGG
jgi:hypothetical protein